MLTPYDHDNRGGFGYIYLKKGKNEMGRVGYTSTHGVFAVERTPGDISYLDVDRIRRYAVDNKLIPEKDI